MTKGAIPREGGHPRRKDANLASAGNEAHAMQVPRCARLRGLSGLNCARGGGWGSLLICGSPNVRKINEQWRGKDSEGTAHGLT
jgi:hypothetical protein